MKGGGGRSAGSERRFCVACDLGGPPLRRLMADGRPHRGQTARQWWRNGGATHYAVDAGVRPMLQEQLDAGNVAVGSGCVKRGEAILPSPNPQEDRSHSVRQCRGAWFRSMIVRRVHKCDCTASAPR